MNRFLLSLLLTTALAAPAVAQLRLLGQEFWTRPAFVERFVGSYGILAPLEPKLTTEETELLRRVAEQMRIDANAAATLLRAAKKPDGGHSAHIEFTLGNIAFQAGRMAEAITEYREAVRKYPDFLRAHTNLGIALVRESNFAAAVPALSKAVELGGGDGLTFGLLGYSYLQLERYNSAEIAYRNAIVFDPENADWNLGLAKALMEGMKYRETVTLLETILAKQPNNVDLWLYQAAAFSGAGEDNRAAANYEIVRRLGRITPEALIALGDIYTNTGAGDIALEVYVEAITRSPNQPLDRILASARGLVLRGATDQGTALINQIKTTYRGRLSERDQLEILKLEARIAVAQGRTGEALPVLERIVAQDPLDAPTLILLGRGYAAAGEREKAEFIFQRAALVRGYETEALFAHARFLALAGYYSKSIPLLERAQNIRPSEGISRYLEQVRQAARSAAF
jgi:Flp pilus assembly protein TadD